MKTMEQAEPEEPTRNDSQDDAEVRAYLRTGPRPGDIDWVEPDLK